MVECFFRTLTIHRLRRDLFAKVDILVAVIQQHSQQLNPFICTAKAGDILEKVKCARAVLDRRLTGTRTRETVEANMITVAARGAASCAPFTCLA